MSRVANDLDFVVAASKNWNGFRVKLRDFIAVFCAACLAAASVLGVIHDHTDKDGWVEVHHCPACLWQVAAVADVPLVFVLILLAVVLSLPVFDRSISIPMIFPVASASRGPPTPSI